MYRMVAHAPQWPTAKKKVSLILNRHKGKIGHVNMVHVSSMKDSYIKYPLVLTKLHKYFTSICTEVYYIKVVPTSKHGYRK